MFGPVAKISKYVARRMGGADASARSPRSLYSVQEFEDTFRELFVTVDDCDPIYRHKRPSAKAGGATN